MPIRWPAWSTRGGGLDPPESRGGGDVPVRREVRVGADVGDNGLRALRCRPCACGTVTVADNGEVLEELRAETGLGDDPQRAGSGVDKLDVPEVRFHERQGSREHRWQQGVQPGDASEVFRQLMQAAHASRLMHAEMHG